MRPQPQNRRQQNSYYIDVDVHKVDKYGECREEKETGVDPGTQAPCSGYKIELLCTQLQEQPSTQNATTQVKAQEKVPKENAGKTFPLHKHTTTKN